MRRLNWSTNCKSKSKVKNMLCVKTKIRSSEIQGIGLFAEQLIPKGEIVWKFMPGFDLLLTKEEIQNLSPVARAQVRNYAFLDKKYQKYMLCGDDGRFFNHSTDPNCDDSDSDITIANKDIQQGEELTVDYTAFYGDIYDHPEVLGEVKNLHNS